MAKKAPKPQDGATGEPAAERAPRKSKVKGDAAPPSVVDDATIEHHYAQISIAQVDVEKVAGELSTKRGVLQNAYKAAKKAGVDCDAMRQALKDKKQEPGVVITLEHNRRRYLKIMGAPVGTQFDLLNDVEVVDVIDAGLAGYQAGKNNEPADNNPHQPGTEEHANWTSGWNRWVAENAPGAKKVDIAADKIAMEYEVEGKDAYTAGADIASNPYGENAKAHGFWREGWIGEQKRAAEREELGKIPAHNDRRGGKRGGSTTTEATAH